MTRHSLALVVGWSVLVTAGACSSEFGLLPSHEGPEVRYPVSLRADPSGRWLYVVGANFDRAHRSGSVGVIDTVKEQWVPGARVEVPTYALSAALTTSSSEANTRRLWVPARDDDSLSVIDVDVGGANPTLSCGAGADGRCGAAWRVGGPRTDDVFIGRDPAGVLVEPGQDGFDAVIHVASGANARVATLAVKHLDEGGVSAELVSAFIPTGAISHGGMVRSPLNGRVYAADVRRNALFPFDVLRSGDADSGWSAAQFNSINLPLSAGAEFGRALHFSRDGGRLYVAYRSPNALLIVDTAPALSGDPVDKLIATVGLGGQPAQVTSAPTGPNGQELVYVTCFSSDDVWVVDPAKRAVVDIIRLPHAPYGLAAVEVPNKGWRLYIGLFAEHRLAVVNLNRADADFHRVSRFIP